MSEILTNLQNSALDCIKKHFKEDPITGTNIANEIDLKERDKGKDGADMRSIINALRTKGNPVCANSRGYYWPRNYSELNEYISEFQNRINDQQKALDGLKIIAMKGCDDVNKIDDKDLDDKLRQLLKTSPLSFSEEDRERITDLQRALDSKISYLKRSVIRRYSS